VNHPGKTPPPAGDGSIDLMGHHIALTTQVAALVALLLVAGWCLIFPRVRHTLRRLAVSAGVAAGCSAVYVGWHDHAHHARLVQAAALKGDPVPKQLVAGWGFFTLAGTVVLFAASTWWLARRRQGRFAWATWPPRFRRNRGPAYQAGAGRPAGRMPGPPPLGYGADPPYGGLPPGFPPGLPPGFGGRR
jgi:hypothetical protein